MPKKVLIIGAECTGKSTLTQALAKDHNCPFAAEYLRTFFEQLPNPATYRCRLDEIEEIAKAQHTSEQNAYRHAKAHGKPFVFCDSGLLLLALYSIHYLGDVPPFLQNIWQQAPYDIIFLTDEQGIDWQADGGIRDNPTGRATIRAELVACLEYHALPFFTVTGTPKERLAQAQSVLIQ